MDYNNSPHVKERKLIHTLSREVTAWITSLIFIGFPMVTFWNNTLKYPVALEDDFFELSDGESISSSSSGANLRHENRDGLCSSTGPIL